MPDGKLRGDALERVDRGEFGVERFLFVGVSRLDLGAAAQSLSFARRTSFELMVHMT